MEAAKVDHSITKTELGGLHGKPFTVSVPGWRVDAEGIVLSSEHRKSAQAEARLSAGSFECRAEPVGPLAHAAASSGRSTPIA